MDQDLESGVDIYLGTRCVLNLLDRDDLLSQCREDYLTSPSRALKNSGGVLPF
jgi:hypothetical protein